MKRSIGILALMMLAVIGMQAQTVTLPPASTYGAVITWPLPSVCTTATPCTFQGYQIVGTCPTTITDTTGWTALTLTGTQATTVSSGVEPSGTTQSFVVETVQGSNGHSGPSNCISLLIPNPPPAPVISGAGVSMSLVITLPTQNTQVVAKNDSKPTEGAPMISVKLIPVASK